MSTLQRYVEELGGELEFIARFLDGGELSAARQCEERHGSPASASIRN
jgi:hypothetical protein